MSNTSSIMAGAYFDQLVEAVDLPARAGLCIHPSVLQGSMSNPLFRGVARLNECAVILLDASRILQ